MKLTFEEAKQLKPGDILLDDDDKRWKVNGQVQLWKTDPKRIKVPLKHGLYSYGSITELDFSEEGICFYLRREIACTESK